MSEMLAAGVRGSTPHAFPGGTDAKTDVGYTGSPYHVTRTILRKSSQGPTRLRFLMDEDDQRPVFYGDLRVTSDRRKGTCLFWVRGHS